MKNLQTQCSLCRCTFLLEEETSKHVNVHECKGFCPQCDDKTNFQYNFKHPGVPSILRNLKYSLDSKCVDRKLLKTINAKDLLFHTLRIHNANIEMIEKLNKMVPLNEKDVAVLLLQFLSYQYCEGMMVLCPFCDGKFLQKRLINHIQGEHENLRKYACNICDWKTLFDYQLENHKQKHNVGRKLSCPHCPYICVETQQLIEHKKKHYVYRNISMT